MTGPAPHQAGGYRLRPATESDVPSVAALVKAAYGHYVERIGMLPRPMTDDYPRSSATARSPSPSRTEPSWESSSSP